MLFSWSVAWAWVLSQCLPLSFVDAERTALTTPTRNFRVGPWTQASQEQISFPCLGMPQLPSHSNDVSSMSSAFYNNAPKIVHCTPILFSNSFLIHPISLQVVYNLSLSYISFNWITAAITLAYKASMHIKLCSYPYPRACDCSIPISHHDGSLRVLQPASVASPVEMLLSPPCIIDRTVAPLQYFFWRMSCVCLHSL